MVTTVGELRALLDELDPDDDAELRVGIQPAYPLAKRLHGIASSFDDPDGDRPEVIWLVVSDEHPARDSGGPYAPASLWEQATS
jgi:hypothetical protein